MQILQQLGVTGINSVVSDWAPEALNKGRAINASTTRQIK